MARTISTIGDFWRGDLPLGRAFWLWGVLGGGIVSLIFTLLALAILASGGPGWLALVVFGIPIPWNLVLLVGIWRSSARPGIRREVAQTARLAIVVWVIVLSVL